MRESISHQPMPTTHWSLVARAGHDDADVKRRALVQLIERYLPAIRSYLVHRKRLRVEDADDLLQGFLMSKVLEQDLLPRTEQDKGRFRTFLLTSLDRYIISEHRRQTAQKRSAGHAVPVDEGIDAAADEAGPDGALDVPWARQILHRAIEQMQGECRASGRGDVWGVFEARILCPTLGTGEPVEYEALVARYGFKSPAQASNVLITGKRMFVRILRCIVGEYCGGEEEIDREITSLQEILAGAAS